MIQQEFSLILAVYIGLFVFGTVYNLLVAWLEKMGYLEGFTWMAVAVGVGVTVIGMVVIDWELTVIMLGAFAFSGSPMIIGAVARYMVRRERSQQAIINEVLSE